MILVRKKEVVVEEGEREREREREASIDGLPGAHNRGSNLVFARTRN